jgi:hypothetical protein
VVMPAANAEIRPASPLTAGMWSCRPASPKSPPWPMAAGTWPYRPRTPKPAPLAHRGRHVVMPAPIAEIERTAPPMAHGCRHVVMPASIAEIERNAPPMAHGCRHVVMPARISEMRPPGPWRPACGHAGPDRRNPPPGPPCLPSPDPRPPPPCEKTDPIPLIWPIPRPARRYAKKNVKSRSFARSHRHG